MHIPDGFLSPQLAISTWLLAAGTISYCLRRTQCMLQEKMVPLLGVMAAFIFAAQMLNFPVLAGTSGHFLGGVLAAVILGPDAGCLILSLVLLVQCLIFQDGGLTALGANILNMAGIATFLSYGLYVFLRKIIFPKNMLMAVFIASWFSVVLAAAFCAWELALSRTAPPKIVFTAMLFVHLFIGLGEGIITASVVSFILKVRPDLIYTQKR